MWFDVFLAGVFAGSAGTLWYRFSRRIPELAEIPDEVIVSRLDEDSARIRVFVLQFKSFWREKKYREPLWRFCEKILYRLHILLMKADNGMVVLLKRVRAAGGLPNGNGNGGGNGVIQVETPATASVSAIAASSPAPRIQEVRRRRIKTPTPTPV